MPSRKSFGKLTERSQDKIKSQGARFGLTSRQSRERYNRGTFNPLSRDPARQVPEHAPYYPLEVGRALRDRAIANWDRTFDMESDFSLANRDTVLDSIENHASESALRRMAFSSEAEIRQWAHYQARYSRKGEKTPGWLRDLGWVDDSGKWHNIFWYH